jgi:hypothetical protein
MALTAEGRVEEAQRAWLAATLEEIAKLIVSQSESDFGEVLACLISARRPLLSKDKVRKQVLTIMVW